MKEKDKYRSDHTSKNIARIANTVQWHSLLSDNKDCHEFRFSIVRIATRQMPQASRIVFVIIFEKL